MKRYFIESRFMLIADNDEDAVRISKEWAKNFSDREDNRCEIMAIREIPFGKFEEREVEI
jgi:hypothetical protein